jgi:hypothetical protein
VSNLRSVNELISILFRIGILKQKRKAPPPKERVAASVPASEKRIPRFIKPKKHNDYKKEKKYPKVKIKAPKRNKPRQRLKLYKFS